MVLSSCYTFNPASSSWTSFSTHSGTRPAPTTPVAPAVNHKGLIPRLSTWAHSRAVYLGSFPGSLPSLIPRLSTWPHSRAVYLGSFPGCLPGLIPRLSTWPHSQALYLASFLGSLPGLIPRLSTWAHSRAVYLGSFPGASRESLGTRLGGLECHCREVMALITNLHMSLHTSQLQCVHCIVQHTPHQKTAAKILIPVHTHKHCCFLPVLRVQRSCPSPRMSACQVHALQERINSTWLVASIIPRG